MKYLRRCSCVLLSCVLLLGAFSVSANAQESEDKYNVTQDYTWYGKREGGGDAVKFGSFGFVTNNGTEEKAERTQMIAVETWNTNTRWYLSGSVKYARHDGKPIVLAGRDTKFTFSKVYFGALDMNAQGIAGTYWRNISSSSAIVYYTDGTTETITELVIRHDNNQPTSNISFSLKPIKDVESILLAFAINTDYQSANGYDLYSNFTVYYGEYLGDGSTFNLQVERSSEEAGILSGISGWVQNIFNSIVELPAKIWSYIENGLKALFIPSEESIEGLKTNFEQLLENKFGAVYQVVNVTFESWERVSASDETNTINMPEVSINLPNNEKFTFGGYEVKIVPDGFEVLVTAIKLLTGVLCTIMFVNGLRKRYDEVMGVES